MCHRPNRAAVGVYNHNGSKEVMKSSKLINPGNSCNFHGIDSQNGENLKK